MNNTEFIIDANVVFSALISGKSIYKRLINEYKLYTIDYIFEELETHREVILDKTRLDDSQFLPYVVNIFSGIGILPSLILSLDSKQKAYNLCEKVDIKDMPYIALAIEMDKPLLTNDKVLFEGLQKQKYKQILLFNDFLKDF